MNVIRRIQHDRKMRKLNRKIHFVLGRMKAHEHDADPLEWRSWARLNLIYLELMSLEVSEYAQKIERR